MLVSKMFVSPLKSYRLKPNSQCNDIGVGASGRQAGHEGRALMNWISVHIRETPESCLALLPCEAWQADSHL